MARDQKPKLVKARAKCNSFTIEIEAKIMNTMALSDHEMDDVRRKLRHRLTTTISSLPFSHIYPNEVTVK